MTRMLLTTAVVLICSAATPAQTRSDFSGRWLRDVNRSDGDSNTSGGASRAEALIIEQLPGQLRLIRERGGRRDQPVTYAFEPLDARPGPESSAEPPAVESDPSGLRSPSVGTTGTKVQKTGATWKDGRLTLVTAWLVNGETLTTGETLFIAPASGELLVETQLQIHHGYESVDASAKRPPLKDVYVRAER